jgi:hypothetical protein
MAAVRADNPAGADAIEVLHGSAPEKSHAEIASAGDKGGVKVSAADGEAVSVREPGFGGAAGVQEANAVKRDAFEINPESARGGNAVGQESFATGFVNGRAPGVGKDHVEAAAAGGDGSGEAGRSAADDEDVGQ